MQAQQQDNGGGEGVSMILEEEIDENYEPTQEGSAQSYKIHSYILFHDRNPRIRSLLGHEPP